ncbi:MAG TPA: hypothetical protein VEA38_12855 [Terriglobales bacterium]|nr:hypothetical protein [Terriglobales bacterium]
MLPKVVVHKQNGHSKHHHAGSQGSAIGEIMRQVHGAATRGPAPSYDILKFGSVVRTESRAGLLEQALHRVDGLHSGLGALIARTELAFARGESPDVRETLYALRAQAGETTELLARLLASAETRTVAHGVVAMGPLLATAAERVRAAVSVPVSVTADASGPSVVGNARRLERALVTLASAMGGGTALALSVDQIEGPIRGDVFARVTIAGGEPLPEIAAALGTSPAPPEPAREVFEIVLARQIVAEHGGAVSLAPGAEGGAVLRVELPAV